MFAEQLGRAERWNLRLAVACYLLLLGTLSGWTRTPEPASCYKHAADGLPVDELPDPGYPVEVLRVEMEDWATSDWDEDREVFVVRIREGIPDDFAVDSLVHEWAHLLTWDAVQESPHDAIWAAAYSRCYREVIDQ